MASQGMPARNDRALRLVATMSDPHASPWSAGRVPVAIADRSPRAPLSTPPRKREYWRHIKERKVWMKLPAVPSRSFAGLRTLLPVRQRRTESRSEMGKREAEDLITRVSLYPSVPRSYPDPNKQKSPTAPSRDSRHLMRFSRYFSMRESDVALRQERQIVQSGLNLRDFLP